MLIYYNNRFCDEKDLVIQSTNRSFLYGDGLFETIKIFKGKALFFNQHYVRFIEGLDSLQMELPEEWSVPYFKKIIEATALRNNLQSARVRLTFWRAAGGYYTPANQTPEFIAEVFPINEEFYNLNQKGLIVDIFPDVQKSIGPLSAFKSANALPYVMAGLFKVKNQLDDVLICNTKGRIIETINSNIFIRKNGAIYTPAIDEGCINGAMRRVLIKMCKQMQMDVFETKFTLSDILNADEIFLTNVIQGIRWVGQVGSKKIEQGIAAILIGKLNEHIMDYA